LNHELKNGLVAVGLEFCRRVVLADTLTQELKDVNDLVSDQTHDYNRLSVFLGSIVESDDSERRVVLAGSSERIAMGTCQRILPSLGVRPFVNPAFRHQLVPGFLRRTEANAEREPSIRHPQAAGLLVNAFLGARRRREH
jgi:hypothetical protein